MKKNAMKGFEQFYKGFESNRGRSKGNMLEEKRNYFLVALVLLSIIFVDLFFWQMKRQVHKPLTDTDERLALMYADGQEEPNEEEIIYALHSADSDSDGVSDYDEIYVHSTSAYIADSDSDGKSDAQEIKLGEDPNCPKDTDCAQYAPDPVVANTAAPTLFESETAVALRQALAASGVSQEDLSLFTDQELMQLYTSAVSDTQTNTGESNAASKSLDPEQLLYFEQLGPTEIRDLLIKAGVDEELIDTIPDDRLTELYLETLSSTQMNY